MELSPLTPQDPTELGGFDIRFRIGQGGMGIAYLAEDGDGLPVVVKSIGWNKAYGDHARERFSREIEALKRVRSDFVVKFVAGDPTAARPWYAMEFHGEHNLEEQIDRTGPLGIERAVLFLRKLATGLVALHEADVIHRDLKPTNILLARDGPKIIDLGIAKDLTQAEMTATRSPLLTETWASPEQIDSARQVTAATDIFNFGLVATYAVTQRHPFGTASTPLEYAQMVGRIHQGRHEIDDGVDESLRTVIIECLNKDPSKRPDGRGLVRSLMRVSESPDHQPSAAFELSQIMSMIEEARRKTAPAQSPAPRKRAARKPSGKPRARSNSELAEHLKAIGYRPENEIWAAAKFLNRKGLAVEKANIERAVEIARAVKIERGLVEWWDVPRFMDSRW